MIYRSEAKINLFLDILGKRHDGYHEIYTLMHRIEFYDLISVEKGKEGINLITDSEELNNQQNLAFKAASLFFETSGIKPQVEIKIEKRIPIGSGLGGGSSNAATTLLALNEIFDYPLSFNELHSLATQLGSDVPFFLYDSPAAVASGRGEIIKEVECDTQDYSIFLAIPPIRVDTGYVYSKLVLTTESCINKMPFVIIGERCNLEEIMPLLRNDLEEVALEELAMLKDLKSVLKRHFGNALLSGSGSSMFSIINPEVKAEEERIKELLGSWGVVCKEVNFSKKGR